MQILKQIKVKAQYNKVYVFITQLQSSATVSKLFDHIFLSLS